MGWEQVKREHWDVQTTNWLFWIPVQLVQFRFVPLQNQVLYVCTASMIFNSILSFLTNRGLCGAHDYNEYMAEVKSDHQEAQEAPQAHCV